jgi:protein-tyrosine phosphatase
MIDTERYGGRRAYFQHCLARALSLAGAYRPLLDIDWYSVDRLVFICKGNICRSPYGEARARLLGLETASFGLEAADGAPADANAARNAQERGVDLSAHLSSRIERSRLREKDLVLLFEPQQIRAFRERCGADIRAISLAGLWARPERPYVSDPYGRSDLCFQECFSVIDGSVAALASRLRDAENKAPGVV